MYFISVCKINPEHFEDEKEEHGSLNTNTYNYPIWITDKDQRRPCIIFISNRLATVVVVIVKGYPINLYHLSKHVSSFLKVEWIIRQLH